MVLLLHLMKIILEHITTVSALLDIKDINYSFTAPGQLPCWDLTAVANRRGYGIIGWYGSRHHMVRYFHDKNDTSIAPKKFQQYEFCAPGQELVEELTTTRISRFSLFVKRPLPGLSVNKIIQLSGLHDAADKPIGDYSSGMKQRVKLAQANFLRYSSPAA